jgi:hypothetical protein
MAVSSGTIRWAQSILDRFVPKFKQYQSLSDTLCKSEEYQEVEKLFTAIKKKIEDYQLDAKKNFYTFVKDECIDKLQLQLLR